MAKTIKVLELPEFDVTEYLRSKEDMAAYLTTVLDDEDAGLLSIALGDIIRASGVAATAGMTLAELDEVLHACGPSFGAVRRILAALGLRLICRPAARV